MDARVQESVPVSATTVRFLGVSSVVPAAGNDTASFLLNDRHLVDTGWYAANRLLDHGLTPLDLEHVILTHCHHDHYLGLPQLLFYIRMRRDRAPERAPLKIIGPAADVRRVVNRARAFLQTESFPEIDARPEVIPLAPGDTYECADFRLRTAQTRHPVQGLCYRFEDLRTGAHVAFTGDTAYHPPLVDHVRGAALLIHESSWGATDPDPDARGGHAGARQAARIARDAAVGQLALVHCEETRQQESLAAAREIFANVCFPRNGEVITVNSLSDHG
ncbi:MAG: hypothetical protein COZ06_24150 [Armatimonadetes bacterium CG_4_10_14_3_um_filter_66_18]|nr:MAG: hypothetical protein COS65_23450 [Armatimonadetes bacterium CG06_land_8_20_14_3_00_66_21]PIW20045.1 MAG: hypothetical protein COW34_02740 [Armatimonadetes bacterium CG17_big_fil_post_rev_8_21_14_2_50_66_6]PIX46207.1 MAG: hypothetical protein COZ57_13225 [Armatimonadetes bacterium CG_4_8_14_3_um_filter_66_20]PIY42892.1 MAG: hypothetical protein COZ06_24150 [Armatimonadetes bacterium CG_4_10_14_3_um_filter_66_18]PIZ50098.1 MAG: hypothetical protein COY42_02370 [Armatimonadetes bacterium C